MKAFLTFFAMCAVCTVNLAAAAEFDEGKPHHIARSEAEKKLNDIIRYSEQGSVADDLLTGHLTKHHGYYSRLFTKKLLTSFAEVEAHIVQRDCSGQYIEGEICGIDANPVSCAQDTNDRPYLYHTLEENEHTATITYHWPDQAEWGGGSVYRMVNDGGGWRLDGVDCGGELKFNMD